MQVTLDGYIAGPNDEADWLTSSDAHWADLFNDLEGADTYLLGRKMYPVYANYWKSVLKDSVNSDPNDLKFARMAERTQHIVFTKGNFEPNWSNTRVAHDLAAEVARLKSKPGKNIIAWGGGNFASNLIDLKLVDEYRFELNPTILTAGKLLFENMQTRQRLTLIDSKSLNSDLLVLRYRPK